MCHRTTTDRQTDERTSSASRRLVGGERKGSLYPMEAAMVRAGSSVPRMAPRRISLPTRGSIGNSASTLPIGVRSSCSVQECARVCKSMQEYPTVCKSIQQCTRVSNSVQEYPTVCKSMQEYARVSNSVQECAVVE